MHVRRQGRLRTPGDHHIPGREPFAAAVRCGPFHFGRRENPSHPSLHFNAGILKSFSGSQCRDVHNLLLVPFHPRIVEGRVFHAHPHPAELLQLRITPAACQKRLGGDASPVGTGSTPSLFFDDCRLQTQPCRPYGRLVTSRSRTDHQNIKYRHKILSSCHEKCVFRNIITLF